MSTRIMVVGSAKTNDIQRRRPRIRLSGFWLNEYGFEPDSLITATYTEDTIVFKLEGKGIETYSRIIKGILNSGSELLQVKNETRNKKPTPHFEVKGFWLEEFGFQIGNVILIKIKQGEISIKKINIEELE